MEQKQKVVVFGPKVVVGHQPPSLPSPTAITTQNYHFFVDAAPKKCRPFQKIPNVSPDPSPYILLIKILTFHSLNVNTSLLLSQHLFKGEDNVAPLG